MPNNAACDWPRLVVVVVSVAFCGRRVKVTRRCVERNQLCACVVCYSEDPAPHTHPVERCVRVLGAHDVQIFASARNWRAMFGTALQRRELVESIYTPRELRAMCRERGAWRTGVSVCKAPRIPMGHATMAQRTASPPPPPTERQLCSIGRRVDSHRAAARSPF